MKGAVLLVDDEPDVLSAYKRLLKRRFKLDTALGGQEALAKAQEKEYAVVVSDLQMPEMDGITLLKRLKEKTPATIRMMLTGKSDLQVAMKAVNEGSIFRFLTKPCQVELLSAGLQAAVDQYELVKAEAVLLDKTLKGAIQSMTQILSITSPESFSRATRIERLVRTMLKKLQLEETWDFELAASLSQLGCVITPKSILLKLEDGKVLNDTEQRTYEEHPKQGALLISEIPRLECVQ